MQIILSRKGFDSANGGAASPRFEDGSEISLPIPGGHGQTRYADLLSTTAACETSVTALVEELTGRRVKGRHLCHLDPDLARGSAPAGDKWSPAFGQAGAAQRHLDNELVKAGDLFLYFGWFRDVEQHKGRWRYRPKARSVHRLFGWLQVGGVIRLGNETSSLRERRPDLQRHPHVHGWWTTSNTIYTATGALSAAGAGPGVPGAGLFRGTNAHELTRHDAASRSEWELPGCFLPAPGRRGLSYHRKPGQWEEHHGRARVRAAARGQEFVFDTTGVGGVDRWLATLFAQAGQEPGQPAPEN